MTPSKRKTVPVMLVLLGALATATAAPKDEQPAQSPVEALTKLYALPEGEVLRRIAPPFAPVRLDYYRQEFPGQAKLIPRGPAVMTFRWKDGKLTNWSMTFSGTDDQGVRLAALAEWLADIYPQDIEGDEGLRQESITGDWVVREGTSAEKVIPRLEEILRHDCKLPIKLVLRDEEREVIVARGKYHFTPVPGYEGHGIQLYGKELVPNSGAGGGTGTFQELLKSAGAFMDRRLVGEVEGAPEKVSWRYHKRSPFTEQEAKEDTDPDGVLKHLGEQTGLTFKEEKRRVRVLFVERTGEGAGQPK